MAKGVRRSRLDAELVRRGLARSREHASELVSAGLVKVSGTVATKAATGVGTDAPIVVDAAGADDPGYASRGAYKLLGALEAFSVRGVQVPPSQATSIGQPPTAGVGEEPAQGSLEVGEGNGSQVPVEQVPLDGGVAGVAGVGGGPGVWVGGRTVGGLVVVGKRCLDAGASTGGFTDVLLRAGAAHVIAVDVGYGQLVWALRTDERVTVMDRTNVRSLTLDAIGGEPVDLVVSDLSFISLTLVLPALVGVVKPDGDLMLMVKPQFEVGKERLGKGGVVRDPALRAEAVRAVAAEATELGWGIQGVAASPLPGPAGNVEYFLWIRRTAPPLDETMLRTAVESGPQ